MTAYLFGAGTVVAKRTDVANKPPVLLGTIQDFEIDIDQSLKTLLGQFKFPVAAAGAETKMTAKAKFARFQSNMLNDMILGQTLTTGSSIEMATAELASSATTALVVGQTTAFIEDLGLFYASSGIQLTPVASGPVAGQYVPGVAGAGSYTIAAADENIQMRVYYSYTLATDTKITMTNQQMGSLPTFSLTARESFTYFGAVKRMVLQLNACVAPKIKIPFKNTEFQVSDLDITVLADQAGNIGTISLTE